MVVMKAQKSWDTPVADETRDVSDASEDIHGITDDITDDAESAEVDAEPSHCCANGTAG